MRARGCAVLMLALAACQSIHGLPDSPAPVNVCGRMTGLSCAGYPADAGAVCESTGTGSACQVNAIEPFVLVVTVPALAPIGGGSTYALSTDDLFASTRASVNLCSAQDYPLSDVCFRLAPIQTSPGQYLISPAEARAAGRYLGSTDGGPYVTLPVTVTFWPRWTPPGTSTTRPVATDARLLNLPLPAVVADVIGVTNSLTGAIAPGDVGNPLEWVAGLPPSESAPGYDAVVEVVPPFDDAYPATSYAVTISPGADPSRISVAGVGLPPDQIAQWPTAAPHPAQTVARGDGSPFDGGWSVYLRDPASLRVLSSRATVSAATSSLRLNYLTPPSLEASFELVIEPPQGSVGLPTLIDSAPIPTTETYPALPPPLHVTGSVQSPYGTAVSATLLFFSDALDDVATCLGPPSPSNRVPGVLRYEARVDTDDRLASGGALGRFSVDLPQGDYAVVLEPSAASGYAKTTVGLEHIAVTGHPVCAGASVALTGLVLEASPKVTLSGSVLTGDGRPLANASVDVTPAAALAPSRFSSPVAEDRWPRPFTTVTGAEGAFSVDVDPGEYDLTVRPQQGTGLPWLVRPDHVAPVAGPLALEPLAVPAPFFLGLTLHDPADNPLVNAVVQAFAFSGGVALPVGEAMTDDQGHLLMPLTTAFARN